MQVAGGKVGAKASRSGGAWLGKALVVGLWSMVSRLLGLVRDLGMAWLLGAGALADALVAATVLPHALRKLLGDGVLSLPVTAQACAPEARRVPWLSQVTLGPVLPVLAATTIGLWLAALVLAPWLAGLLAPGHRGDGVWLGEAAFLLRLASPYLGCAVLAAFAMGLLHALGEFGRASLAPVCFNLCVLAFMFLAWMGQGQPAGMIALGIASAGMVQAGLLWCFLWQAERRRLAAGDAAADGSYRPARALGLRLRASLWKTPGVVLASSSLQLAVLAAMASASLAGQGRMSALYFADRLLELPVGVVGACMGIVALPELSRSSRAGDMAGFDASLRLALHAGLLFSLPAAAGLWAIAPLLAELLLGHGAFGQEGVALTALALRCLVPALPACILLRTLVAACHARGLDRLAWLGTVCCTLATLALGLLAPCLGADATLAGPLACTAALWAQCLVLAWLVFRQIREAGALPCPAAGLAGAGRAEPCAFLRPWQMARMATCGLAAGGSALAVQAFWQGGRGACLALACLGGACAWLACLRLLCPREFRLACSRRAKRSQLSAM